MWAFFKLMVWGIVWLATWPSVTVYRYFAKKPRIDNCFTWAIRQWQDDNSGNGYLVIRWCRSNKTPFIRWPHFLYLEEQHHQSLRHFVPKIEDQEFKLFPEAFFEGKVVTGDREDDHIEN